MSRSHRHPASRPSIGPGLASLLTLVVVTFVLLGASGGLSSLSSEVQSGVIVASVLMLVTALIAAGLARADDDPGLFTLIMLAFAAKIGSSIVRYIVLHDAYGAGDADRYFRVGVELSRQIPAGEAVFGEISGTRFTEVLSGLSYVLLPDSQLAGFFFFSWIAFLGVLLFTRAVRIALPDADHHRYDLLVFFLPTLLFWPSSLGKETWMVAMIGLAAYGVARLLTHQPSGLIPLGLGVWGATTVRPHVALMILAPLAPAWLVRPSGRNRLGLSPFLRGLGFVVVILGLLVLVAQAEEFLGVDSLDSEGAEQVAEETTAQTAQGGSQFDNQHVRSPLDIPEAAVTVFARPFIWEVTSVQAALSALEGLVLLALLFQARRQLLALPRNVLRYPYLLYCAVFTLAFIVAYSSISNFGILVRQRAQLFPIFLVLLLPLRDPRLDDGPTGASANRRRPYDWVDRPHAVASDRSGDQRVIESSSERTGFET